MSDYKRLTERVGKGIAVKETSTNDNKSIWNAIERLAELEDKIENGTLIELPCPIGTIIYYIGSFYKVKLFKKTLMYDIFEMPFELDMLQTYKNNWFLTKAEAEKKLEELKGKK